MYYQLSESFFSLVQNLDLVYEVYSKSEVALFVYASFFGGLGLGLSPYIAVRVISKILHWFGCLIRKIVVR